MKINLANYRLHLVLCPIDMRRGFQSLSALAAREHENGTLFLYSDRRSLYMER